MRKMIEVGGFEIPKEDWESTPASVRELLGKLVKENEELRVRVRQLEDRYRKAPKGLMFAEVKGRF
jgi:hypothetical protein